MMISCSNNTVRVMHMAVGAHQQVIESLSKCTVWVRDVSLIGVEQSLLRLLSSLPLSIVVVSLCVISLPSSH
jgi:hypothetical protein